MDLWLSLGICLSFVHYNYAVDVHYFVGSHGSDSNSGLNSSVPVEHLSKAISLASSSSNGGKDIFIELLAGYHNLPKATRVSNHGKSLTIRSYKNQTVHVTGGQQIPPSRLRPVTNQAIINALPVAARRFVRYVHLPDLDITNYGTLHEYGSGSRRTAMLEVFYNGKPFRLARWPNKGFIDISAIPDGVHGHRIKYNSTRPSTWKNLQGTWVYGYWYHGYNEKAYHVKTLDTRNMIITFDNKTNIHSGFRTGHLNTAKPTEGGYFRFINVLSELDEPGEYYLDKTTGNLYMWLPTKDGSVKSTDVILVSMLNTCLLINSRTQNVVFSDLVVEGCRERGIYASNVKNIQLKNMEIRNTGDYGVYIESSIGCTISRCVFHDCDGGIRLTGGDRKKLLGSGNTIENNKFYRLAREGLVYKPAVYLYGVGDIVRYNELSYGASAGISFFGNDHIIEYNHIHHICRNISNCGALVSTQDWTYRGNKIRYNIVHDMNKNYPGLDVRAVMLDNMMSSATVTNNVLYNNHVHVMIGGGRDNTISDNVMYNAYKCSLQVDGRGIRYGSSALKNLQNRLHSMPFNNSLWSARYPELARILSNNESLPKGNQIHKNIIYNQPSKKVVDGFQSYGWARDPIYFNITDTGYSYGPRDHYDVKSGDLRVKCHLSQWANRMNFKQVITPNDVGPQYDVGPAFHKIARHTVKLTGSPSVCTTVAPAKTSPMPAYLPDGAGQTPLFKVYDEGCWLHIEKCANDPQANGTYRDMYGERLHNAANNEAACLKRAVDQWHFCGSKPNEPVVAIYGPTGATTYGGDGCFEARYGCPRHGGPADGHVIHTGSIFRDSHAEQAENATRDQERCLARAQRIWAYCGSSPNHPVTSIFRPTGATRTAGGGCWISVEKCPKKTSLRTMFHDAAGTTNALSDDYEEVCFTRAEYYWRECGSDRHNPVTAIYRPTTRTKTYP